MAFELKISSFNIRNYGLGGDYEGRFGSEHRHNNIKEIIHKNLIDCDVMIFQEIFDIDFFTKLLPEDYKVQTYQHHMKRHQYILICYKEKYDLLDPLGSGYILEGSALSTDSSRPAIYGLLVDAKTKEACAYIIGVHLKSGATHTRNRLLQVEIITNYIKSFQKDLPVIIAGDFNSQSASSTYLLNDDVKFISDLFAEVDLVKIKNAKPTFHTFFGVHDLDHFWVSKAAVLEETTWVYDVFSYKPSKYPQDSLRSYFEDVSDHLPLKLKVSLKN